MKNLLFSFLAVVAVLSSCTGKKAQFPVYVWQDINKNTNFDQLQKDLSIIVNHPSDNRDWNSTGLRATGNAVYVK